MRKRRSTRATVVASLFGVLILASSLPARAGHALEIVHVPPPAATAGEALTLAVTVVSTCQAQALQLDGIPICGGFSIQLRYRIPCLPGSPNEQICVKSQSRSRLVSLPVEPAVFEVPGEDVRETEFIYSFVAYQWTCIHAGPPTRPSCHPQEATAYYSVPVGSGGT